MRHLDRVGLRAHEPRSGQHREHLLPRGIRSEGLGRHPAADGAAVGPEGHQSQEEPAARHALVGVHRLVEAVGRLGDRARDAAGGLVARDRERRALPAEPRLDERVRQVGECARLARGIPEDDLHQPGLESQAGAPGRLLDGFAQRGGRHRADEMHTLGDEGREVGVTGAVVEEVGAHDEDDGRTRHRSLGDRAGGRVDVGITGVEHLLELVHDHHVGAPRPDGLADPRVEVVLRRENNDAIAATAQGGNHAGAHERGLAAARGARHGEEARPAESGQRGLDVGTTSEEVVLVLHAERLQPAIGAGCARTRGGVAQIEGVVVAEDAQLEFRQLSARLHAELVGESLAGCADRCERVGLSATAVQGGGEQHPPSLSQRRHTHQSLRIGDERRILAEPEMCVDQRLLELHPDLVQALRLNDGGSPRREVGVGCTAPEFESALRGVEGACRIIVEVPAGGCREPFEALDVHGFGVDAQRVRAGRGGDRVASDRGPNPTDRRLQLLLPGAGRLVAPERIGEFVDRDRSVRAKHQRREH